MRPAALCLSLLLAACGPVAPAATKPTAPDVAPLAAPASGGAAAAPTVQRAEPTAARAALAPLDPPVAVRVGIGAVLPDGGLVIADEKGYFRELGLDVSWTEVASTPDMLPSLSTGELDVGFGGGTAFLFNAFSRGVQLKIVAGAKEARAESKYLCFVVRKDLAESGAVRDVSDWRGKRIGMQGYGVGTISDLYLDLALRRAGLQVADVSAGPLGFAETNAALANKALDIGFQSEPAGTLGVERGLFDKGPCSGDIFPGHYISYVYYSPTFAAQQTDAARRFMLGYLRGVREYQQAFFGNGANREQVIEMMARRTSIKEPEIWERMAAYWANPDGAINLQTVSSDQDWYHEHGFVERKVDLNQIVDASFSDWAVGQLGPAR